MANYTQNDVNFTDISTSLLAVGAKVTATPYQVDGEDNVWNAPNDVVLKTIQM